MLSRETTAGIACSFLLTYYREFVKKREFTGLLDLYSDASHVTYAKYNEEKPEIAQGRNEIAQHFAKLDAALGHRKIEVRFVDYAPLPGNCIHIVCHGVMYLCRQRLAFIHVFVLAPTQHRTNTYHIASDYFRVMVVEIEHIPEDSIVMTPAEVTQHLLQDHERRQQAEERRRQLRQQRAAEALWLRQQRAAVTEEEEEEEEEEEVVVVGERQWQEPRRSRGEYETRGKRSERPNNSGNSNCDASNVNLSSGDRRKNGADVSNRRRWEQGDMRNPDHVERFNSNNKPARAENSTDVNGNYGVRRGERHSGTRAEGNKSSNINGGAGVKRREEGTAAAVVAAPKSAAAAEQRERRGAVPANLESGSNNNKKNVNNNRPAPRSKMVLEKQTEKKVENNDRIDVAKKQGGVPAKKTATKTETAAAAATTTTKKKEKEKENKNLKRHALSERTGDTEFIRFVRVPKTVRLSDIKDAVKLTIGSEPLDAYWFGRSSADCVVNLGSSVAVEQMVRNTLIVVDSKLTAVHFYP